MKEFMCDNCKANLRKELFERRKNQADKLILSDSICERAAELVGGNVLVYVSIGSEVDTSRLIELLNNRSDVKIFAPYTADGTIRALPLLKTGKPDNYGNLPQDCYASTKNGERVKLDFCITPLIGFNGKGYRIGYGKGCYDRFFADCETYKIGLAFDCQRIEFTNEEYDVPLDCCVTDKDVIYFNNASDSRKI